MIVTTLSFLALEQAIAGNVTGTVKSIPQMSPVQAHVFLIDKNTGDTTKAESNIAGNFSMNLNPGNYTLEVAANHHYFYQDTSFVLNGDSTLDLRVIRGEYDNGTPILQSTHGQFNNNGQSQPSILDFAKTQYSRQDASPGSNYVINYLSPRRRSYIEGLDSITIANIKYVQALNESLSVAGIYYDEQPTDSAGGIRWYGRPAGHPDLQGGTAVTEPEYTIISTNPTKYAFVGARTYVTNDQGSIDILTLSDESLHQNAFQRHNSLDSSHVLTLGLIQSAATQTTPDEAYIGDINQTMIIGSNWRNHKDTIRTITISPIIPVSYTSGWNMVSVPTKESNMTANEVFPEKIGNAFKYNGGYQSSDTLENGVGYWIKLNEAINKEFQGTKITKDTLDLMNRWNIIGSISAPVPVDSIEQIPPGILVSSFYGYSPGGYAVSDTIYPGKAYWVKSNGTGQIILKKPE